MKADLTLEELAEKLNTDRHYVWKLENGRVNMSLEYLDKIIKKLGSNSIDFFSQFRKQI